MARTSRPTIQRKVVFGHGTLGNGRPIADQNSGMMIAKAHTIRTTPAATIMAFCLIVRPRKKLK